MINKSTYIMQKKITVSCSEDFESVADWLLGVFAQIFFLKAPEDGERVQCGWSFFIFRQIAIGELVVYGPDFNKNPFCDETSDLSDSFFIQIEQNEFAKNMSVEPVFTSFQDKVIVSKGFYNFDKIYMTRSEPDSTTGDSGWYIGVNNFSKHVVESPELEAIYAFQLTKYRPEILQVLSLPPGCIVKISDAEGVQIKLEGQ